MKRLLTLGLICFSLVAKASVPFKHIVVFGDSLSDNGNSYERTQHFVPQTPPYYEGRFSDGPVWVEYLSDSLSEKKHFLQDFALGGAGVTGKDEDIDGVFTLANQVKDFLSANDQVAEGDNLYIFWIGANNYLILPEDEESAVHRVQLGISKALDKLINAGAKQFLVLNMPDLSKTPLARSLSDKSRAKLARYTNAHNQMIEKMRADYQHKYPHVQWHFYDINNTFKRLVDNPEEFGFTNVENTCYDEDFSATVSMHPVIRIEKRFNLTAKRNCDDYLFFDPVHPTGRAHKILYQELVNVLGDVFNGSKNT